MVTVSTQMTQWNTTKQQKVDKINNTNKILKQKQDESNLEPNSIPFLEYLIQAISETDYVIVYETGKAFH